MHEATNGCLFVEGLKMRPTAFRVLNALFILGRQPTWYQDGSTIAEIAATAGLSEHVVRARLQDLRRLGLVESGECRQAPSYDYAANRYGHYLTEKGLRRVCMA